MRNSHHISQIYNERAWNKRNSPMKPMKLCTIFSSPNTQECLATHSRWNPKLIQGCCHGWRWRLEKVGGRNGVEMVVEERNDERFGVEWGGFEWGLRGMMKNLRDLGVFDLGEAWEWFGSWYEAFIGPRNPKNRVWFFWQRQARQWLANWRASGELPECTRQWLANWRASGEWLASGLPVARQLACLRTKMQTSSRNVILTLFLESPPSTSQPTYSNVSKVASKCSWKHVKHYSMLKSLNCP